MEEAIALWILLLCSLAVFMRCRFRKRFYLGSHYRARMICIAQKERPREFTILVAIFASSCVLIFAAAAFESFCAMFGANYTLLLSLPGWLAVSLPTYIVITQFVLFLGELGGYVDENRDDPF